MVAKTETLKDDFNDNSLDTSKWFNWGGVNVSETNNELEITTNAGANWYGIESVNKYDLTGSYVHVRLVTPGDTSILYHMTMVYVQLDTNNQIKFSTEASTLIAEKSVAGVNVQVATIAYDPAVHKWLKLRESAGTIYWDYSIDGQIWTNFTSLANPFDITSVNIDLGSGNWQATSGGTTSKFDDLNIVYTGLQWFGS